MNDKLTELGLAPEMKFFMPAFSSPIIFFRLPGAGRLNKMLLEDVERYRAVDQGVSRSNGNGWHSPYDFFKREEISFKVLAASIKASVFKAIKKTTPDLLLSTAKVQYEGWINSSPKGAYNVPHEHGEFHWSGCYYVHVPETQHQRGGDIEFLDPRTSVSSMTLRGGEIFSPKVRYRPKSGDLILFPAYLTHWVYPNEEEEERVTIAFNAAVREYKIRDKNAKEI